MKNLFLSFTIKTTSLLAVVFCFHIGVLKMLKLPLFDDKIILSYIVNTALVITIFGVLYLLREKYKAQLGFVFLIGSFLKFAVFFIIFYPIYKHDGQITKLEFAAFFIPYALGLIIETFSLTKWLNKLD